MRFKHIAYTALLSLLASCSSNKTEKKPPIEIKDPCDVAPTTFVLTIDGPLSDTNNLYKDEFYLMLSTDSVHKDTVWQTDYIICDDKVTYQFKNIDTSKTYRILVGDGGFPYPLHHKELTGKELLSDN